MIARFVYNENTLDLESGPYSLGDDFLPPPATWNRVYTSPINDLGGDLVFETAANRQFSFKVRILASGLESIEGAAQRLSSFIKLYRSGELYFEFRAGSLPEPLWGQLGAPDRYQVVSADVALGSEYASAKLRQAGITVTVSLTVKPLPKGTQQRLASALGGVWIDNMGSSDRRGWGLRIMPAATNKFHNPVFGYSTWNQDWTAAASIISVQNTDPKYCFPGSLSSALVTAQAAANNTMTETLTLTVATYYFVALVARPDGAAVTSSDCAWYYNGAERASTYRSLGNGMYLVTMSMTGVAAALATGMIIKNGRSIYLMGSYCGLVNLQTVGNGDMLGWAWDATVHDGTSTSTAGRVRLTVASDSFVNNLWAIHLVWKPDEANNLTGDRYLFSLGAANIRCTYTAADDKINLLDNTNTASTGALAFSAGDVLEVLAVGGNSGLAIYAKNHTTGNTYSGTNATYTVPAAASYIYIGTDDSAANHAKGIFELFEVYNDDLTSAQNTALQTAIGGVYTGHVGDIPTLWTKDGDDVVDNILDSTHQNYAVAIGIPGDLPAITRYRLSTWSSPLWLGNHVDRQGFWRNPARNWYAELGGTAVAGNSNGDALTYSVPSVPRMGGSVIPPYAWGISGPVHAFTRVASSAGTVAYTIGTYLSVNGAVYSLPDKSASAITTYKLFYTGDINAAIPDEVQPSDTKLKLAVNFDPGAGTILIDFVMFIQGKLQYIILTSSDIPGGGLPMTLPQWLNLEGKHGTYDTNGTYVPLIQGDEDVSLEPGAYNTLQNILAGKNDTYTTTLTMTYTRVDVTPQWSLI